MDKFTKLKQIGEGSFGKAILVKHKENGENYVVKEIGIATMKPKERNEARKEVSVLSKMRHPNIVQYIESFEENGKLYIVMEYCDGGDLYALINKQRGTQFGERQVLDWFVQICLALKHVHDRKILHRDIKTSNIFLTKGGLIKLGDFGIARVLNNTMELARTCIGTPYYLSPEICENKPYNNKSDVWALGCVVYEILTLKHAFEAGNMKNLVLKIIRGSYPPVPSRYSYDLRSLVSQLFRRNPRERPSVNSILKKSFIAPLTVRFLSPEQHESEFSHTVLHRGRNPRPSSRPSSAVSRYQPVAEKRIKNLEVRGAPVNARRQQIAAAYGPSVAVRKPPRAAAVRPSRVANSRQVVNDVLDQKRQQLQEEQQLRKDKILAEKKKRLDDLQKRQKDRAEKLREAQQLRDRDEARVMNLKRSADIFVDKEVKKLSKGEEARDRPISAPQERNDYGKYHQYLDMLNKGDRAEAAKFAAPGLDKVRAAWEERERAQNAIMIAQVNRAAGEDASNRAQVVNEYLQRKQEALQNKNKGDIDRYRNGVGLRKPKAGVAAALQPYSAKSKGSEEQRYLDRLQQIRMQNFHERRALQNKHMDNKPYKVVEAEPVSDVDVNRKKKMEALQQQANDRARLLQNNMEERRKKMSKAADEKRQLEEKARARGIVPPDERPVKYNPSPIGITQALHAVGAPIMQDECGDKPEDSELSIPSAGHADIRRRILRRVNERFSIDLESETDKSSVDSSPEDKTKPPEAVNAASGASTTVRPLPEVPKLKEAEKAAGWKAWGGGEDIKKRIAQLPLQETASQMDATSVVDQQQMSKNGQQAAPLKKQWVLPSGTFVRRLNQMELSEPTITMATAHKTPMLQDDVVTSGNAAIPEKSEVQKSPVPSKNLMRLAPKFGGKNTFVVDRNPENAKLEEENSLEIAKTNIVSQIEDKPDLFSSDEEIEEVAMLENLLAKDDSDVVKREAWSEKSIKTEEQENTTANEPNRTPTPPLRPLPPTPSVSESPLFTKRLKPKSMISTSPVKSTHADFEKQDNLSKSLYCTASEMVLMKLTLGQFDSPSPKMLRTCSLPDLLKIPEEEPTTNDPSQSVTSEKPGDLEVPRISVASSMNDTNFDEDEEPQDLGSVSDEEEGSCHLDDAVATDDEELDHMREQLKNALKTSDGSSSPPFAAGFMSSHKISADSDEESWESVGSGSSSFEDDDCNHPKKDNSDTESIFCRLERNREQLEKELGFDAFLNAYKCVQAIHEDEDEELAVCQEKVKSVLGDRFDDLYPRILQLVMADGAYCEDND